MGRLGVSVNTLRPRPPFQIGSVMFRPRHHLCQEKLSCTLALPELLQEVRIALSLVDHVPDGSGFPGHAFVLSRLDESLMGKLVSQLLNPLKGKESF